MQALKYSETQNNNSHNNVVLKMCQWFSSGLKKNPTGLRKTSLQNKYNSRLSGITETEAPEFGLK